MSHGNVSWKYVLAHPDPSGQPFCPLSTGRRLTRFRLCGGHIGWYKHNMTANYNSSKCLNVRHLHQHKVSVPLDLHRSTVPYPPKWINVWYFTRYVFFYQPKVLINVGVQSSRGSITYNVHIKITSSLMLSFYSFTDYKFCHPNGFTMLGLSQQFFFNYID